MATIQPSVDFTADGITRITWATVTNADTCAPYMARQISGAVGNIQLSGTFDSATVTLGARNLDSGVFASVPDSGATTISLTAAGMADFSTGALWLAPQFSGGGGSQSITATMVLRG